MALAASAAAAALPQRDSLPPKAAALLQQAVPAGSSGTGLTGQRRREQQRPAGEQLEPGSYAAALLRTFEPGAAMAEHRAALKLKAELMRHNAAAARQFLLGAAARASNAATSRRNLHGAE